MKFLTVEITNYGPYYGTHTFHLADRGLLLVMGDNQDEPRMDSNGSGKSMLFDALDWCLWGDNPRGDHAEAMFNEEAFGVRGAECKVKTTMLQDNGILATITRRRTKSKNELEVVDGFEDKTALDTKETQKVIERLLGLDRDVFHAAVLFGQTDLVHYADATDGKRMEILTKILQLDEIDIYLTRTKERVKKNTERRVKLQADLAGVDGQLLATRPEDLDVRVQEWDSDRTGDVSSMQASVATLTAEYQEAQNKLVALDALRVNKEALAHDLAAMAVPEALPEVEIARREVEQLQRQVAVGAQECVNLENQLIKMQNLGKGFCSQCGQFVTDEHLQAEILSAQGALQVAADQQAVLRGQLSAAETVKAAVARLEHEQKQAWQQSRDQKMQEVAKAEAVIRVALGEQARVTRLANELADSQNKLEFRKAEINPWIERRAQVEKERYELERRQGQIGYELESLKSEARHLDFWMRGFGAKGLKSYILDSRLQELTDAANEWVGLLTGGTIWVRFEATKQTRGNKVVNAPDVRVFRWNPDGTTTERSYKSWSGGEKQRLSFAIDFGLSRLVARRAKQTYDLLILDEVFRHLDRSGKEAVMEMLQSLAREKSSLIVVEHDSEFQGQFEQRVLVTKHNRRSTIRELDAIKESDYVQEDEAQEGVPGDLSADPDRKRVPRRKPVRRPVS